MAWVGPTTALLTITNDSDVTVTAFLLERILPIPADAQAGGSKMTGARTLEFFDSAADPKVAKAIPPRQSITIREAAGTGEPPRIRAALFEDGQSWGNPDFVGRLSRRRTYLRQSLETVIADLKAAIADPAMNSDVLISRFESAFDSERRSAGDQLGTVAAVRGMEIRRLRTLYPAGSPITKDGIQNEIDALEARLVPLKDSRK